MSQVPDYSDARPTRAQLVAGGSIAVVRYLKKDLPNTKDLRYDGTHGMPDERATLRSWGFGIGYNAEQGAADLITQPAAYWHDYGQAVKAQLAAWQEPASTIVVVSSDTVVTMAGKGANVATVIDNFGAFAAALAPWGMTSYAQIGVIDILVADRISPPGALHWLPGSIGWSIANGNNVAGWNQYLAYPHAGMVQLGPDALRWWNPAAGKFTATGGGVTPVPGTDYNVIKSAAALAAMGFSWPPNSPYAPTEDEDMEQIFNTTEGQYYRDSTGWYDHVPFPADIQALTANGVKWSGATGAVISDGFHAMLKARSAQLMAPAGAVTVTVPPVDVHVNAPAPVAYSLTPVSPVAP